MGLEVLCYFCFYYYVNLVKDYILLDVTEIYYSWLEK